MCRGASRRTGGPGLPPTEMKHVADKNYYSFDEVMKNLEVEEDELKRLVSAGEIRAFRDKDTMRFKAEDVARLKTETGADLDTEELDLDFEDDLELEIAEPAGEDEDAITLLEDADIGDELVLEDEESPAALEVEELDLGGDDAEVAEEDAQAKPAKRGGRPGKAAAGASKRTGRASTEEAEEVKDSAGTLAMLVIGIVVLVVANFIVFDAVTGHASNPLTKAVANMFNDS